MNLPHIKPSLGKQSLRAITQPIVVHRGQGRSTGADLATDFLFDQTMPVPDPSSSWRTLEVARKNLLNLPYSQLAQIALDLSPEVNKGLHDFLRFVNPSHVLSNSNPVAEQASNAFVSQLDTYYGSFRSHIDSLWSGIFLTGGSFPELILGAGGRAPLDLVFNDPSSARFRRERDPMRGPRWRLGQDTRYGFNYLDDSPLIKYLGFDRLTDNPFGRPIVGPAIHSSVFLLGLIQDLRRVIAKAGISKTDYSLDAEQLLALINRNPDIANSEEATADFIAEQIELIKGTLAGLEVDGDYVHASIVSVNHVTNPMMINMNGLSTVIETLQQNVVNGFKGISALLNIMNSTTETHIRSQLEYFVSALQSLQDEVAAMLSQFFDISNQVQGISGETEFKFRRQRSADKMAMAQIEQIRTDTVVNKVDSKFVKCYTICELSRVRMSRLSALWSAVWGGEIHIYDGSQVRA